ncbi:hypothetical protein MKQ70_15035 [Chitinophaga sedimenti]|uniref:hypothetical protein n=1 Tax=Chitinophaga sedimenti TaxID=2033606 RepID=UPI0020058E84|nr:hypothetical protein [Chitinophaga sedimenti]MCK7556259.1 hypothetical protein [Chitinophaga sedimenti]
MQQVNAKLNTYYDLKKYFLKEIDLETAMKQFVDQRVSAIRTSLDSIYGKGFASLLPPGLNVDQLVQLDTAQLKRLFSTEEIQATIIAQGAFFTDTAALRRQAKDKALREVLSLKKELESGEPARRQLVRFDQLKGQLSQWMNTDESRIRNAKELFPLGDCNVSFYG